MLLPASLVLGQPKKAISNKVLCPRSSQLSAETETWILVIGKVLSLQGEGRHWGWQQEGAGANVWLLRELEKVREDRAEAESGLG